MSDAVRQLKPHSLWNHFADLNQVPRPSKKEQRVIEFITNFSQQLGLETLVDEVGNVVIRKPASTGREDRLPVVLQSHLDMVCQKNANTDFDFDSQGIRMAVDGDWVHAEGTTLGADNGIGVASIMTLLAADDVPHPPLEALFTIDEETGMTGAKALQGGVLQGKILLNLDTEDDDELTIGCAGGMDVSTALNYQPVDIPAGYAGQKILVRGLKGGHSGVDIHLGRANANKLMNRLLWGAARVCDLRTAEIDGGGLRNAIPRESHSIVAVPAADERKLADFIDHQTQAIGAEYCTTDPQLEIQVQSCPVPTQAIPAELQRTLLAVVYACPCGIHRMCPDIEDLVQTSNNLARVLVQDGSLRIDCLTRSSVNSERDDLAHAIEAIFELLGGEVATGSDYPGWQPNPEATVVKLMSDIYERLFGEPAHVAACHAGLECGILGTNYPDMEMISFGPNIRGAHSPDERVQISSVQKYWRLLRTTLDEIPS